ncbi:probable calcium-binding protein CML22 [Phragmites australis]|uniref:probable calcium-binding protein CML22 n=1 Tax=Phragmites australis TaxID=29695 RepID=UPI002D77A987|nr:probable calcium-binding protein CML22 [Phragmites australis]
MSCQAHTVSAMPPSAPLVKLPLLPRGLLSYLPTNLSSILPSGRESSAMSSTNAASSPQPAPPSPKEVSSSGQQQAGSGSKADAAELARVFELFDHDGDGRITREELEDSLGKLGIPVPGDEVASMIALIDANGDGCVDVEEFGELYRAIMAGDKAEGKGSRGGEEEGEDGEEDEDMREAFRVFDANGDGYITVDELGVVLSSLGLKQGRTAEECRRMIGRVDRDGDGRVDFGEFLQMMRAGGLATLG